VSGIAVVGFGPGTIIEEPVGRLCSGCRQPVGPGQRGYMLRGGLFEEAWHRSCTRDRSVTASEVDWMQYQPDEEAALTGRGVLVAAGSALRT